MNAVVEERPYVLRYSTRTRGFTSTTVYEFQPRRRSRVRQALMSAVGIMGSASARFGSCMLVEEQKVQVVWVAAS
jgi:hypothetical protein